MRRKRFGYPVQPGIGYKQSSAVSGLIKGKRPIHVVNLTDLRNLPKGQLIVMSRRLGARKKLALLKQAHEMHLIVLNAREAVHETR